MPTALLLLFKSYWQYLAIAAAVVAAGFFLHHRWYNQGVIHERGVWDVKVMAQQARAARAQTELESNNRNAARSADNAIAKRVKVVTREKQIAASATADWRLRLANSVPSANSTCDPVVSIATQCIDDAATTRSYAVDTYDASEANADQVDQLLNHIEQACKTWSKENGVKQECPSYGADERIKATEIRRQIQEVRP